MAIQTMNRGTAAFLVSEANGTRSRDRGTVVAGSEGLLAGTILGRLTANGNYVPLDTDAVTGAEDVAGILFEETTGTAEATVIVRDCEVNGAHLIHEDGAEPADITAAEAALTALGIIVR